MQKLLNKQFLGWVLVVVFILFSYYFFSIKNNQKITEITICTQEALQCMDGSYVSKTGPQCEFTKCPNQTSFIGTLRQDSNGFQLITSAPENGGMEVAYVMPLILEKNNVTEYIGKKVEVSGTFTSGNTLKVDKIEKSKNSDPSLGEISVGQTMFINGVKITLNKIVKDSRCPIDVTCIWAGNVVADIDLQSNTDKETMDMTSDKKVPFDSFQISIVKILPQPKSQETIASQDYKITFQVTPN